ncbi:MAG: hypothetical protein ACOYNC_04420 [Bacteroidales bacterium]
MQTINSQSTLRAAIQRLENLQAEEGVLLKEHFLLAYESVKPLNLVISTLRELTASRELKDNLINTSVGMATGYLSKLLFEQGSRNPFKKLAGNAIMFGIVDLVAKNPETVKSFGKSLWKMVAGKPGGKIHHS